MYKELHCSKNIRSPHISSVSTLSTPPSTQENSFTSWKHLLISITFLGFLLIFCCSLFWHIANHGLQRSLTTTDHPVMYLPGDFKHFLCDRENHRQKRHRTLAASQITIHYVQSLPLAGHHHSLLLLLLQEACNDTLFKQVILWDLFI